MYIQREEHKNKGAFFIEKDGEWAAEMTYYREGRRKIVIDDVEVDEKSLGKGIVEMMVEEVARYAEENNLLIKPLSPRVRKVLESSEDYEEVLAR